MATIFQADYPGPLRYPVNYFTLNFSPDGSVLPRKGTSSLLVKTFNSSFIFCDRGGLIDSCSITKTCV
ncbi:hypothetical protein FXW07_06645 [Methanosarcina sp. DH1]|uniref:hypothetical protein n=1 Tax=Methanosarcina sp. DH1 TaxID=2605695 RepID=UPI001E514B1D|nr:hypothetical protein [Methanosarcina sp. DH1]MCC4766301.1 hypothetical protein [Methanosarcina sp. DH1]